MPELKPVLMIEPKSISENLSELRNEIVGQLSGLGQMILHPSILFNFDQFFTL